MLWLKTQDYKVEQVLFIITNLNSVAAPLQTVITIL